MAFLACTEKSRNDDGTVSDRKTQYARFHNEQPSRLQLIRKIGKILEFHHFVLVKANCLVIMIISGSPYFIWWKYFRDSTFLYEQCASKTLMPWAGIEHSGLEEEVWKRSVQTEFSILYSWFASPCTRKSNITSNRPTIWGMHGWHSS